MKLAAGSLKYLLLDLDAATRNIVRSAGRTEPVSRVIEVQEDGTTKTFRALSVDVKGATQLRYSQHAPLLVMHNEVVRVAYATTAEVVLDEVVAETPVAPATTPKPAKPAKPARVTTVATEENKPNGEE